MEKNGLGEGKDNSFYYENNAFDESLLTKASVVQPKMLPPFFRERTRWLQKMYIFLVILAVSISIGITALAMIDNLAISYGLVSGNQVSHLIFILLIWYLEIGLACFYTWWSRHRNYLYNYFDVIGAILSPIILIVVTLIFFIDPSLFNGVANVDGLVILVFGVSALAAAIISGLFILLHNLYRVKSYPEARYRSMFTLPGLVIMAAAPLVLWAVSDNNDFRSFGLDQILYPLIVVFVGVGLFLSGVLISMKYRSQELSSASMWVQLSSSLPSAVILMALLVVGFRFASQTSFETPLIIALVLDVLIAGAYGVFVFVRGRIHNINKTNPLFNEFVTKGFVVTILVIGLILVSIIPQLVFENTYAPTAFGILAVTSAASLVVLLIAHFSNIVVYERYTKFMTFWAAIVLIAVLIVIFVLGTLNQGSIFINVFSRGIVIIMLFAELVNEIVLFALGAVTIEKDITFNSRKRVIKNINENNKSQLNNEVVKERNGK